MSFALFRSCSSGMVNIWRWRLLERALWNLLVWCFDDNGLEAIEGTLPAECCLLGGV